MIRPKRKNKTKEEIVSDMETQKKVLHIKEVVKNIFPEIENLESVFDAETVVNALSGFISAHIEKKLSEIKMSDISIDLANEEEGPIKTALLNIVEIIKDEGAKESSETLERLGRTLRMYSANTFMKQPMNTIKITDIVS